MTLEELRLDAAERIRATHRRLGDSAAPTRVTITERDSEYDVVRVEYADGAVREFQRARPVEEQTT
jgi:hypothetical protein